MLGVTAAGPYENEQLTVLGFGGFPQNTNRGLTCNLKKLEPEEFYIFLWQILKPLLWESQATQDV